MLFRNRTVQELCNNRFGRNFVQIIQIARFLDLQTAMNQRKFGTHRNYDKRGKEIRLRPDADSAVSSWEWPVSRAGGPPQIEIVSSNQAPQPFEDSLGRP